jgi:hypothetical protein
MNYIHQALDVGPDEVVEVMLDHPANVQLLDEENFERYQLREEFHYHGGYAPRSPYLIRPPRPGLWHLVIDLGGYAGRVRAWVRLLPDRAPVEAP